MNSKVFEDLMRSREVYHHLTVPADKWIVIRVDGRGFTKLMDRLQAARPYDLLISDTMIDVAFALGQEFSSPLCYTQSDEISFVLQPGNDHFGRSVEKLVSTAAGVASGRFSATLEREFWNPPVASFDARIWVGDTLSDVVDYFSWRHADCTRNAISSGLYWTIRDRGATSGEATRKLSNVSTAERRALLTDYGVAYGEQWDVGFWSGEVITGKGCSSAPLAGKIFRDDVRALLAVFQIDDDDV